MTVPNPTREDSTAAGRRLRSADLVLIPVAVGFAVLVVLYAYTRPLGDFVEYWAAAHLLVSHQSPYSVPEMYAVQQNLGWRSSLPLIPLNPPWALPLLAPLGLLKSYAAGWLIWIAAMASATAWSSRLLMDMYFGDLKIPEISSPEWYRYLFAFSFFPTLLCLAFGQITPLLLLGICGFVYFENRNRPTWAGASLALTAVKPQLVYLVLLAILLSCFRRRRWGALLVACLVVSLFSLIAIVIDHAIFAEYLALARSPYPYQYASGAAGILRAATGGKARFWTQFLPLGAGLAWCLIYWKEHRSDWRWIETTPALITASILTSAWAFPFDEILLVVPIVCIAASSARELNQIPKKLVFLYTALNALLIVMVKAQTFWAILPAPICAAVLLWRSPLGQKHA